MSAPAFLPLDLNRVAEAHEHVAAAMDDLVGSGVLLDPDGLRRLRDAAEAVLPVAEAYARHLEHATGGGGAAA